jgi:5-methylthioribose kinase
LQPGLPQTIFTHMIEIGPENAIDYLRSTGRLAAETAATARALAWGVSNVVLRIEPEVGKHFVVKQSREQLRTADDWFSRIDRIYREMDVMAELQKLLPEGVVPRILFEDRENYLFAMQAVSANHVVWKVDLLAGRADINIAETAADYLAMTHTGSFDDAELRSQMIDREVFDQLRIDPFYRRIAIKHPRIEPVISQLIDEMSATPVCLVHADFSPKNILIIRETNSTSARLALVDFETAHFGDPAFDLGFFFSHLLLKTVMHTARADEFLNLVRMFHSRYFAAIDRLAAEGAMSRGELDRRSVGHTAACMLSRIDGKSTVDYLPQPSDQELVRQFCLGLLTDPPPSLTATFERLEQRLGTL